MFSTIHRDQMAKLAAVSAIALAVVACSDAPSVAPTTITVTTAASAPASSNAPANSSAPTSSSVSTSPTAEASSCGVNPSNSPVLTVEPYQTVPDEGRVSVTLSGVPSGTVIPGAAPTEVVVTVCNDSAVDYPAVGVVVMLSLCSCGPGPGIAKGTVERFDDATGSWIPMENAAVGTGMDYLAGFSNVQELPKGAVVTLRYRIALDASMTAGEGGVEAAAVNPEPLNQLGNAHLPFSVVL